MSLHAHHVKIVRLDVYCSTSRRLMPKDGRAQFIPAGRTSNACVRCAPSLSYFTARALTLTRLLDTINDCVRTLPLKLIASAPARGWLRVTRALPQRARW